MSQSVKPVRWMTNVAENATFITHLVGKRAVRRESGQAVAALRASSISRRVPKPDAPLPT
jgi:hypothetical protein